MKDLFLYQTGISYRKNDFRPGQPTLVFLHGLSGSASAWYAYENKFKDTYNLLIIDLRGHGFSLRPRRYAEYHPKRFAEDISELLNDLLIRECVLVGHSLGTLVALELTRIRKHEMPLVLLSPNFGIQKIWLRRALHPMFAALAFVFDWLPLLISPHQRTKYSKYVDTGDFNVRRISVDVWHSTLRVYVFCLVQIYHHAQDAAWQKISARCCVIHGEDDKIIPVENVIELGKNLRSAELHILPNRNHILVLNSVEEVSALVSSFIRSMSRNKRRSAA